MTNTWDLELVTMETFYSTHSQNLYLVRCEGQGRHAEKPELKSSTITVMHIQLNFK
jgi:hypothetical protein